MKFKNKFHRGLTLVEIIIVLTIIGLLAAIGYVGLHSNVDKANDAKRKADLQKIADAFEDYYTDENCYPASGILSDCGGSELKPYLNSIPCDPVYHTPYCYLPTEPKTGSCYQVYRLLNTLKYLSDPAIKSLGCDSSGYCGWEAECSAASGGSNSGYNYGVSSFNTSVVNPTMPQATATPSPTGGRVWGCTPQGDCNNYSGSLGNCTYLFSSCAEAAQYCGNPAYRCR